MNEYSKNLARKFFVETKIGIWIMGAMALLNTIEGLIHLVVAVIGIIGGVDIGLTDWRVWTPIVENFLLGAFSLLTGWALGITHNHHHDHSNHKHKE